MTTSDDLKERFKHAFLHKEEPEWKQDSKTYLGLTVERIAFRCECGRQRVGMYPEGTFSLFLNEAHHE